MDKKMGGTSEQELHAANKIVQQYLKNKLTLHALQPLHPPKTDPKKVCVVPRQTYFARCLSTLDVFEVLSDVY